MKEYLLLFRSVNAGSTQHTPEYLAANMEKWKQWIGGIAQNGKFVGGQPLTKEGRTMFDNGSKVTDGPFAEAKEVINGYVIVNAADFDEAVKLSMGCPIFADKGSVEVREISKMDM